MATNNLLKFARGTKQQYLDASSGTYKDYIFFTTDTKEILMYKDENTCGSFGARDMINDIEISTNESNYSLCLTIHYSDGSTQQVRSTSLREIIHAVVVKEEFPEIEARISSLENDLMWKVV